MPINLFWSLTDIQYFCTSTGMKIVVTTDAPVHLFMRWTHQPYRKHQVPFLHRGTSVSTIPRFCFDVFEDNEQEETGDTYTHTFIKEPWLNCECRYFYFWALIEGWVAVSESPIFTYQRLCPITITLKCLTQSGFCYVENTDWAELHGMASGIVAADWTYTKAGYQVLIDDYKIHRSCLYFDTAFLGKYATIHSATLRLRGSTEGSPLNTQYLWVYHYTKIAASFLWPRDYGFLAYGWPIVASFLHVHFGVEWDRYGWNELPVYLNKLDYINKLGKTVFSLRSQKEVESNPQIGGINADYFSWHVMLEEPTLNAELVITYTPKCNPCPNGVKT